MSEKKENKAIMLPVCPYFGSEHPERKTLNCDGARIIFPDKKSRDFFIKTYCADITSYSKCTLCKMMDRFFEENFKEREEKMRK